MRFEDALLHLGRATGRPLPGPAAQAAMAPRPRPSWDPGVVPAGVRAAAGLALVYPREGRATLLLTVRGPDLATHRGQVSLPGGAVEAGETVEEAALREAEEEIGLDPAAVSIRLPLTPLHIPVSGYVLHPVVGTAEEPPPVRPRGSEVERIVEVELGSLTGDAGPALELLLRDGVAIEVPYFDLGGAKLWGATAMIVAELLAVLGAPIAPHRRG